MQISNNFEFFNNRPYLVNQIFFEFLQLIDSNLGYLELSRFVYHAKSKLNSLEIWVMKVILDIQTWKDVG